jgi:hypothetical protein
MGTTAAWSACLNPTPGPLEASQHERPETKADRMYVVRNVIPLNQSNALIQHCIHPFLLIHHTP